MNRSRDVAKALAAARTLASIVTTMKTLSAVRIGRYREAVKAMDASHRTIELAFEALFAAHPAALDELASADPAPGLTATEAIGVVAVGPDRGLCGALAERIADHAHGLLAARSSDACLPRIAAVGERVARHLGRRGWQVERRLAPPSSLAGLDAAASDLVDLLDAWWTRAGVGRLYLVYARPVDAARAEPHTLQLLPLDRSWLRDLAHRTWPTRNLPILVEPPDQVLRGLLRNVLALGVVRAFAATQASENAARLAAMSAAERRVEERIRDLSVRAHAARQTRVTEELLDVQSAFEAVRNGF